MVPDFVATSVDGFPHSWQMVALSIATFSLSVMFMGIVQRMTIIISRASSVTGSEISRQRLRLCGNYRGIVEFFLVDSDLANTRRNVYASWDMFDTGFDDVKKKMQQRYRYLTIKSKHELLGIGSQRK